MLLGIKQGYQASWSHAQQTAPAQIDPVQLGICSHGNLGPGLFCQLQHPRWKVTKSFQAVRHVTHPSCGPGMYLYRQCLRCKHLIMLWLCRLWPFFTSPSQSTLDLTSGEASRTTQVTCPRTAGGLPFCQWVNGTTITMRLRGQPIQALNGGNLMLHILSSSAWLLLGWLTISGCQARRNWPKLPGMSRVLEGNMCLFFKLTLLRSDLVKG